MAANYGIKVSQTGIDVGTASSKQLVFSSGLPSLKMVGTVGVSVTVAGSTAGGTRTRGTVAHGVAGTPSFLPFVNKAGTAWPVQHTFKTGVGGLNWQFDSYINGTNAVAIVFNNVTSPGTSTTFNFKFYLFSDNLA